MKITNLRVNHSQSFFVGRDVELSWRIEDNEKENVMQNSYEIRVYSTGKELYYSGNVKSNKTSFIPLPLVFESLKEYLVKVDVEDNYKRKAHNELIFKTALLNKDDFKGVWISSPFERNEVIPFKDAIENRVVCFKKKFALTKTKNTYLFITSYGVFRAYINGKRVGNDEFTPGFTPYKKRLNYEVYDVSMLLSKGENEIDVVVGDGWYFNGQTETVGENIASTPSLLFQIQNEDDLVYTEGNEKVFQTNIIYSDLFMGEKVDLTLPYSEERDVITHDYDKDILTLDPLPGTKCVEEFKPSKIYTSPKGETIIDFGQVITGRLRIKIHEKKGGVIKVDHFEEVDKDGSYISLFPATQCDTFISNGEEFVYEPLFTFHGFRYVRVSGITNVKKEDFTALLLTTPKENKGSFITDNEEINRLYKNIRYSQKNNMLSIPTDCPTREKAGWTGDISLYVRTALYNEEMTPFLSSYLDGLLLDQDSNGSVPIISPYTKMYEKMFTQVQMGFNEKERKHIPGPYSVAGWSDALINIPYEMYNVTGNELVLEKSYDGMKKFIDNIIEVSSSKAGTNLPDDTDSLLWDTGFHFGEWLIPGGKDGFEECKKSSLYISVFFGYIDVLHFSEISKTLKKDGYKYYQDMAKKIKDAIHVLMHSSLLPENLMGMYVLSFAFDLVPEDLYESYKSNFVSLVEESGYTIGTGFLATPYIFDALEKIERKDLIGKIVLQKKAPSWLYEVEHGATTIWENWISYGEDGSPKRTSFDHYAFGVIDSFFFEKVCGIKITNDPSFITISPDTSYGIKNFKRSFVSEYGEVSVEVNGNDLHVTLPVCMKFDISWCGKKYSIGSGSYHFGG